MTDPTKTTITPPKPPAAPVAPVSIPIDDFKALIKLVKEGNRSKLLELLRKTSKLNSLITDLESDKRESRNHRLELRRAIRFVKAETKKLTEDRKGKSFTTDTPADIDSKFVRVDPATGQPRRSRGRAASTAIPERNKFISELAVADGTVVIRTGAKVKYGSGGREDGFVITYNGNHTGKHWLMFAYRQVELTYPAPAGSTKKPTKMMKGVQRHSANTRSFLLTTSSKRKHWTTDGGSPDYAFYEYDTTLERNINELKLGDAPSANASGMAALFTSANPPDSAVSRFGAAAYLVDGMDVVCKVDIELSWDITRDGSKADGYAEGQQSARLKAVKTKQIEAEHRVALGSQMPDYDYFPGPDIPVPLPLEPFEPLAERARTDLGMASWDKNNNTDRFRTVARVAQANQIPDVNPDLLINDTSTKKTGLNLPPGFRGTGEDGEVIYLDAAGAPKDSLIPLLREGKLPTLAISLSQSAFELHGKPRTKEYTLAAMRHEMMHAAHFALARAWLVKWRDDPTDEDFHKWLLAKVRAATKSDTDFRIMVVTRPPTASAAFDRTVTELLSWTEDLVTAMQFDMPAPDMAAIENEAKFPAAVIALRNIPRFLKSPTVEGSSGVIPGLVQKRIKDVACGLMTAAQRQNLLEWLKKLQAPDLFLPASPTKADKDAVEVIRKSFQRTTLLKDVEKIVKSCPP